METRQVYEIFSVHFQDCYYSLGNIVSYCHGFAALCGYYVLLLQQYIKSHECVFFCNFNSKNLHMPEERIQYLKELSTKDAIYERLASALGEFRF